MYYDLDVLCVLAGMFGKHVQMVHRPYVMVTSQQQNTPHGTVRDNLSSH